MTSQFIAYYRVSTSSQGIDGLGIEAQKASVAKFLNGGDWQIIGEFVEVESGKKNNRPELSKAIELAKKTGAKLVIAKLDRLARNVHFITGLMESGIEFVAVDMPQANKMTVQIMAVMAENERDMISARTKAALSVISEKLETEGQYVTKAGKVITERHKGSFSPETTAKGREAMIAKAAERNGRVKGLIEAYRASGKTLQATADELNKSGLRTSRGKLWTPVAVSRIEKSLSEAS